MYLWSIDIEAVLVAMSCFSLLCEEADIRCGSDEVTVTYLLPNYHLYQELAQASTILTTGWCIPVSDNMCYKVKYEFVKIVLDFIKMILFCKTASEESRVYYREQNHGKVLKVLFFVNK